MGEGGEKHELHDIAVSLPLRYSYQMPLRYSSENYTGGGKVFLKNCTFLEVFCKYFFIGKPYRDDCDCSDRFASRMFLSLSRKICKFRTGFPDPGPEEPNVEPE